MHDYWQEHEKVMISSSTVCCLCLQGANYNSGSARLSIEARIPPLFSSLDLSLKEGVRAQMLYNWDLIYHSSFHLLKVLNIHIKTINFSSECSCILSHQSRFIRNLYSMNINTELYIFLAAKEVIMNSLCWYEYTQTGKYQCVSKFSILW